MIAGLIIYLWLNQSTVIYQERNYKGYEKVSDYQYKKNVNNNISSDFVREYKWNLGKIKQADNCLSFFTKYEYVDVYIDDELIYSFRHNNNVIKLKAGRNWAVIPLSPEDSDKEVRVKLTAEDEIGENYDVNFFIGSKADIIEDALQVDLPCIILGIIALGIGIVFCGIAVFHYVQEKRMSNLIYIGILSLITGFWRLFDTKISILIFPHKQPVTILIVFFTDMLLGIPCILFIQSCFKKRHLILDILCVINIVNGFIMIILELFSMTNIRENIIINNIILLISALTSLFITYKELKEGNYNKEKITTFVFVILCCISAIIDIIIYYVKDSSRGLIITTLSFLTYFIILGIMSINQLNNRAIRDMHTGLYNKSECIGMIENTSIIRESTALLMFDLNYLKAVNDNYGHKFGDKLIFDFAQIILEIIPMRAFAGRYGGDEFIVIIRRCNELRVYQMLEDLRKLVEEYNVKNKKINMTYAYGYALSTEFDNCTMQMLMEKADHNMYLNKKKYHKVIENDVQEEIEND